MTTHDRLPSRRAKLHAEKIASLLSLGPIGKVLASHFEERVSAAPQSTGQTVWTHVSVIRDVLSERGGTIDGPMFDALYTRLEASGMAPLSKATLYGGAMGIAKRLMDDGAIPAFKVPRRYAHKAVLAATPPPRRMTDASTPTRRFQTISFWRLWSTSPMPNSRRGIGNAPLPPRSRRRGGWPTKTCSPGWMRASETRWTLVGPEH